MPWSTGEVRSVMFARSRSRTRCSHSSLMSVSKTGPITNPSRPNTSKPPRQPMRAQTKPRRVPSRATVGRTILSPQNRTHSQRNERGAGVATVRVSCNVKAVNSTRIVNPMMNGRVRDVSTNPWVSGSRDVVTCAVGARSPRICGSSFGHSARRAPPNPCNPDRTPTFR